MYNSDVINNQVIPNNSLMCPIYFEDHKFGGNITSIENFTSFKFDHGVKTTIINGEPYFCASDICLGLYLDNKHMSEMTRDAVEGILLGADPEDLKDPFFIDKLYFYINIEIEHKITNGSTVKQMVSTLFISEPVLFMYMFRSKKKEAMAFKGWLSKYILPKIRLIGRDGFMNYIANEREDIQNILAQINKKYESISQSEQNTNIILTALSSYLLGIMNNEQYNKEILNATFADLFYRIDSIGMNTNTIINEVGNVDQRVMNIASGLNTIFGK